VRVVTLRLGKTPARPGAVSFAFTTYQTKLPAPPAVFGHEGLVASWGMKANDTYGCCVPAGAAHETMMWNREAGVTVTISDTDVLEDYAAMNGHHYPITAGGPDDQGTDMQVAASYRRKTGVLDAHGHRHTIGAYLAVATGDVDEHLTAAYLFGAVGIGIRFPDSAMTQFQDGKPWDVVAGAKIDGGHYIPLVGRNEAGNLLVVTWGKVQEMTPAFLQTYNDESLVYLSTEALKDGKTPEGFDLAQLQADLKAL
jgi:hypothetical protein